MEKQSKSDKFTTFITVIVCSVVIACFTSAIGTTLNLPPMPVGIITVILLVIYYYGNIDKD